MEIFSNRYHSPTTNLEAPHTSLLFNVAGDFYFRLNMSMGGHLVESALGNVLMLHEVQKVVWFGLFGPPYIPVPNSVSYVSDIW